MNEKEFEKIKDEFQRRLLRQLYYSLQEIFCNNNHHNWVENEHIKMKFCWNCWKIEKLEKEIKNEL